MVATRPMMTVTSGRRSSGKRIKLAENTLGIMAPPKKPCSARKTIIDGRFQAKAQAMLISVKVAADSAKSTRVERMRASRPESGIITTSATRYEVCTQLISSALAERPAWIWARLLETIWMSRIAMNMPSTMAIKVTTSRALSGGTVDGAAGGARRMGAKRLPSISAWLPAHAATGLQSCRCVLRQAQDEALSSWPLANARLDGPHPEPVEGRTTSMQPDAVAAPLQADRKGGREDPSRNRSADLPRQSGARDGD